MKAYFFKTIEYYAKFCYDDNMIIIVLIEIIQASR